MEIEKIKELLFEIESNPEIKKEFLNLIVKTLDLRSNSYHPMVFINGNPTIGKNFYIGEFSEINAKGAEVIIGNNCDIASFVAINVADSHKYTLGISNEIERKNICLEDNVFVGSHSFIGGNTHIGHHTVVSAGTILINAGKIPPYSLVVGNPPIIKEGYYKNKIATKTE